MLELVNRCSQRRIASIVSAFALPGASLKRAFAYDMFLSMPMDYFMLPYEKIGLQKVAFMC